MLLFFSLSSFVAAGDLGRNFECIRERDHYPLAVAEGEPWEVEECIAEGHYPYSSGEYDAYGMNDLHSACKRGRADIVQLLLNAGADIHAIDKATPGWAHADRQPIHYATTYPVVEVLLDNGADIEARNKYGDTPLSEAAGYDYHAIVQVLINRGANIESRDNDGYSPLLYAAWGASVKTIRILLEAGADYSVESDFGETIMDLAGEEAADPVTTVAFLTEWIANAETKKGYMAYAMRCIEFAVDGASTEECLAAACAKDCYPQKFGKVLCKNLDGELCGAYKGCKLAKKNKCKGRVKF